MGAEEVNAIREPDYEIKVFDAEHPLPKSIAEQVRAQMLALYDKDTPQPDCHVYAYNFEIHVRCSADLNVQLFECDDIRGCERNIQVALGGSTRDKVVGVLGVDFWADITKSVLGNIVNNSGGGVMRQAPLMVLSELRVRPDFRGRGVGTDLMTSADAKFRDVMRSLDRDSAVSVLTTHPSMNTHPFFERLGYRMEETEFQDVIRIGRGATKTYSLPVMSKVITAE